MADTTQPAPKPTALAQRAPSAPTPWEPDNLDRAIELCERLSKSNLLPPHLVGKPNDVLATVLMGRDLGLTFMQSLQNIDCIEGRPSQKTKLKLALVRRSPLCEYIRLVESTPQVAVWATKRVGEEPQRMRFTMADAQTAGLVHASKSGAPGMYQKWPALMLKTRCVSQLLDQEYGDVLLNLADDAEVEREDDVLEAPVGVPAVPTAPVAPAAKPQTPVAAKPAAAPAGTPAPAPPPQSHPDAIDAEFSPADPGTVRAAQVVAAAQIKTELTVASRVELEKLLGKIQTLPDDLKSEMRIPYKERLVCLAALEAQGAAAAAPPARDAAPANPNACRSCGAVTDGRDEEALPWCAACQAKAVAAAQAKATGDQ